MLLYHVVYYIPSAYLFYIWKFEAFAYFHPTPPSPHPTFGNHRSDLFFSELVCFWNINDLQYCYFLVYDTVIWYFDRYKKIYF